MGDESKCHKTGNVRVDENNFVLAKNGGTVDQIV